MYYGYTHLKRSFLLVLHMYVVTKQMYDKKYKIKLKVENIFLCFLKLQEN